MVKAEKDKQQEAITPAVRPDEVVWAEANLLRLPFFALSTKNLGKLDVMTARGEMQDGERKLEFTFEVSRHVTTPYPGPLSRRIHYALLTFLAEQGYRNPVKWSWGEMYERLGIPGGGDYLRRLKGAIIATASARINSRFAVYLKRTGEWLTEQSNTGLYQNVKFYERDAGDKRSFDYNQLWFADWYLENIALFHARKINMRLWKALDEKSTIASRLYEMLLYRWTRGPIELNYSTLVNLLPVTAISYPSHARRQIEGPLGHLLSCGVLARHQWEKSKTDEIGKVVLRRGAMLTRAGDDEGCLEPAALETLRVETIERTISPAERLVSQFYAEWAQSPKMKPAGGDIEFATKLLSEHGEDRASRLVLATIPILRKNWPEAKTFQAIERYVPDALKSLATTELRETSRHKQAKERQDERERQAKLTEKEKKARDRWELMSERERQEVRNRVFSRRPEARNHGEGIIEKLCLSELLQQMS